MNTPDPSRHGRRSRLHGRRLRVGVLRPLRSRRFWRWLVPVAAILVAVLVLLRGPLADRLWPDTRIQQLLAQGERALAQGHLSAADGSGAREAFAAALALDSDRGEARDGLARTGTAALAQARTALRAGDLQRAHQALELAQALQVPRAAAQDVADQLRRREAAQAGLEDLLDRAAQARAEGRLDDGADSALPLYQRVLALAPARTDALEGREDALSDLLQSVRTAIARGDLAEAAPRLAAARGYDPGHVDLPATEAAFNEALQVRRQRAETRLRRGQLDRAATDYRLLAGLLPQDERVQRGLEQVAAGYAAQAARLAADYDFAGADAALAQAGALAPQSPALRNARQALARAHQAQASRAPTLSAPERTRRLRTLLARIETAEAKQQWITPPGASAYDALREAQALAPRDPRVLRAVARVVPATRQCFADALVANRLRAAQACLDAWQTLAPHDAGLADARTGLAQRWIAVGSERLGAGDEAFARQALEQARRLDAAMPELPDFAARVRAAATRPR